SARASIQPFLDRPFFSGATNRPLSTCVTLDIRPVVETSRLHYITSLHRAWAERPLGPVFPPRSPPRMPANRSQFVATSLASFGVALALGPSGPELAEGIDSMHDCPSRTLGLLTEIQR